LFDIRYLNNALSNEQHLNENSQIFKALNYYFVFYPSISLWSLW